MRGKTFLWLFILLLLLITGCEVKTPAVPSWDVDFNVPLMNKDYFAGDLTSGENFDQDSTQIVFFQTNGLIEGANIESDKLKISENPEGSGLLPILKDVSQELLSIHHSSAEDNVQIVSGSLLSGVLKFYFEDIRNDLQTVTITFLELKDPDGNPFIYTIDEPVSGTTYEVSLANCQIYGQDDHTILTDLHFSLNSTYAPTTENFLGYIKIFYDEPMLFYSIRGLMYNLHISADDFYSNIDVDYPDNLENAIELNNPQMKINVWNKIGFDAYFHALYRAVNTRTGDSLDVPVVSLINASMAPGDSILTQISLDDEIGTLMSIYPDQFKLVDPYFEINNPTNQIGFASINIGYSGNYTATVPFDFTLHSGQNIRPKDLTMIEISESNQQQINDNIKEVKLTVRIFNEFAAGMDVDLFICNSDNKDIVYQSTPLHSASLDRLVFLNNEVEAGTPDTPHEKVLEFLIDKEDLAVFSKYPTIYFGMQFRFDESNTQIHAYEKIKVITALKAKITIGQSE